MAQCLPGMPCYENPTTEKTCVTYYYPNGCEGEVPFTIQTSNIIYNGPNLPNSGIVTGDTLSTVLAKLDAAL